MGRLIPWVLIAAFLSASSTLAQVPEDQAIGPKLKWESVGGKKVEAYFGAFDPDSGEVTLLRPLSLDSEQLSKSSQLMAGTRSKNARSLADLERKIAELDVANENLQAQIKIGQAMINSLNEQLAEQKSRFQDLHASISRADPEVTGRSDGSKVSIGQRHITESFSIRVTDIRIAKVEVTDIVGTDKVSAEPELLIEFEIENLDERKILRYNRENMFLAGHFRLTDDVGNQIRGVSFGAATKVKGALTGGEDISPGESASHVEVFNVPPPKTKFLILEMKLDALGGDGVIEFKFPAADFF